MHVIHLLISSVPREIIPSLLQECDDKDEGEGGNVGEEEADFQGGEELGKTDEEEEEVEEELELMVEDNWDEG